MPLILCPECKCEISDKDEICVHCGCPISKQKRRKSVGNIFQNLKTNIVKYNKILIAVLAVCIIFIILHCCFNRKLNADQIRYKGEILTLNSNADNIAGVFLEGAYSRTSHILSKDIYVSINDDNLVKWIRVTTSKIETYKGISVGDEVSKIESSYQYEKVIGNDIYVVIDNENNEVDILTNDYELKDIDSWVGITYYIKDKRVDSIEIYDSKS